MRDDIEKALNKNKEINKFFTTLAFNGMLKGIENHIKSDETVIYIRNANAQMNKQGDLKPNALSIKGKLPVVIAITDQRALIYHKIFPNERLEQFPNKEIRSYDFNKGLTSSKLRITSLTKSVDIDLTCNSKEVKYLNDILEEITRSQPTIISNNNQDITQLLRDLSKLRDDGILTDEEFDKKKTELLSKI
ncbi:SHOCT domain-containing protein [Lutispora sp.]|uniref:SHOCT domain-containing protein n=1 Tax=Lutispora sp. TaxID=2828727 RepID=UPI002B1F41E2|nr:SHOCT domain-containing protein [Lutispora sp.]MEA4961134.1 SHOCT domain-containing protein [Lutispora sp.]